MRSLSRAPRTRRGPRSGLAWTALLAFAATLAGCLGSNRETSGEPLTVGEDARLEGQVMEVDATPMVVDGDGEITLRTERHGRVLVRIPAGERLCRAQGLGVFMSIAAGDSVRAVGRVTRPGEVTVCASESHLLEKLGGTSRE